MARVHPAAPDGRDPGAGDGGPGRGRRAPGQDLPELPEGTLVVDDPREGKGPVQGIAAGLAALSGRAESRSSAPPTCRSCTRPHPAGAGRVGRPSTDVALPVARGYRQPLAAAYRRRSRGRREAGQGGSAAARLPVRGVPRWRRSMTTRCGRPGSARLDPDLDSVLNVNSPPTTRQPGPGRPRGDVQLFGTLATGDGAGPRAVRAATVGAAAAAGGTRFRPACHRGAERRPDHPRRPPPAGAGRHRLLPVRGRGRLSQRGLLEPSNVNRCGRRWILRAGPRRRRPTAGTTRRCRSPTTCCAPMSAVPGSAPGCSPAGPGRRRPARARRAAGVRVLPAGRHAADHEREVRGGGEVAADRDADRRAGLQPVRDRGQAHRPRRDRHPGPRSRAVRAARRRRRRRVSNGAGLAA